MDRDDFPQENYNACFMKLDSIENKLNSYVKSKKVRSTKIRLQIAHSNQAFELWYLLHLTMLIKLMIDQNWVSYFPKK
ncbi:hypothetical protein JEZ13_01750 [bacterium]|nr:hypothetical protein [bacterium]